MPRAHDPVHDHRDPRTGPRQGRVRPETSARLRKRHANDFSAVLGGKVARYDRVVNWYRRGQGR